MNTSQRSIPVVRIKLGAEQPARRDTDDRDLIGYREGLSTLELWNRGREAWKMKADSVLGCELVVIAYDGIVRLVGTVEGVRKYEGGRLGIEGTPIPDHPLIGQTDPLDNSSQNPITYGRITLAR